MTAALPHVPAAGGHFYWYSLPILVGLIGFWRQARQNAAEMLSGRVSADQDRPRKPAQYGPSAAVNQN
jgi:hypothetical protein